MNGFPIAFAIAKDGLEWERVIDGERCGGGGKRVSEPGSGDVLVF